MTTPSSGITGATLARDKIDRYRSTGAFGKPAYQSRHGVQSKLDAVLLETVEVGNGSSVGHGMVGRMATSRL